MRAFVIVIFDGDGEVLHIKRDPRVSIVGADDRVLVGNRGVRFAHTLRREAQAAVGCANRSGMPAPRNHAASRAWRGR
jgi:hypothetical protein